jgi:cell wall-associated NlpC family hydrolase
VTGANVVAKATTQLGVVEKGGKDDKSGNIVPYWDWWKAATGENGQGQSWCACFVSWCFSEVFASSLIAAKNKSGFIYCPDAYNYFKKKNQLVPAKSAQAGDIILFDWSGAGIADHVGIVVENHAANGYLITIEGNTSAEGIVGASQSNGGGVYKRKRFLGKTIIAVARPAYPTLTPTK